MYSCLIDSRLRGRRIARFAPRAHGLVLTRRGWRPGGGNRIPSHSSCLERDARLVAEAAQMAQNATAGYVCDYCTKRGPVGINEIKEWMNTEIWRPG